MAASLGFAPSPTGSKPDMLLLHHEARNWWPARVTLPVQRIKSPLHHFNACRPKLVLAAGFAPALATLSTSCLCWLDYASRMNWSLQPVTLRHDFFTKEIRRLLHGGEMVAVPSAALGPERWLDFHAGASR